jgi:hypothetical protein
VDREETTAVEAEGIAAVAEEVVGEGVEALEERATYLRL